VMVWRGPDVWRRIPGEIQPLGCIRGEWSGIFQDGFLPPLATLCAELTLEQAIRLEPRIRIPVAVKPRREFRFFILRSQQIANADCECEHFRIVVARVLIVAFG